MSGLRRSGHIPTSRLPFVPHPGEMIDPEGGVQNVDMVSLGKPPGEGRAGARRTRLPYSRMASDSAKQPSVSKEGPHGRCAWECSS